MKIPTLTIDDDTESFFRNISVYEQFFSIGANGRFINYLKFMNCLINTAEDVELLCENKILHNCLGDEEVVANMFNRLRDSIALPPNFYGDIFHNVNEYWDRPRNRWMTNLGQNYFNGCTFSAYTYPADTKLVFSSSLSPEVIIIMAS
ncbi:hypothetical protein AB3S75_044857 [Citrus x aurantiifolia]